MKFECSFYKESTLILGFISWNFFFYFFLKMTAAAAAAVCVIPSTQLPNQPPYFIYKSDFSVGLHSNRTTRLSSQLIQRLFESSLWKRLCGNDWTLDFWIRHSNGYFQILFLFITYFIYLLIYFLSSTSLMFLYFKYVHGGHPQSLVHVI